MYKFDAEQTIIDISLLYELSLNIGQSLDIYENCDQFLQRLMSRKNFNYSAVWLKDSYLDDKSTESTLTLAYSYPERYSKLKTTNLEDLLVQVDAAEESRLCKLKDRAFSSFFTDEVSADGDSAICYRLKDIGFLIIISNTKTVSLEDEVNRLEKVFDKFAMSLQGCLAHQQLLNEISERQKVTGMLFQNQEKLKQAQTFASMGVWEYFLESGRLEWSDECGGLFGLSRDEFPVSFAEFLELVHPADRAYVVEVNNPATMQKEAALLHYEHRIIRKDGSVRWVREEAGTIYDQSGRAVKLVGMVIDITERKLMEEEVHKAREELEQKVNERTKELVEVNISLSDEVNERRLAETTLRRMLLAEKMIAEISSMFAVSTEDILDLCIDQSLKMVGQFYNVDRSYIFLFSTDGTYMDNTHEWCAPGIAPEKENLQQVEASATPWWISKLAKNEAINIPLVGQMPPEAEVEKGMLQAQGNKSVLVVPLYTRDSLLGFIGFDTVHYQKNWAEEEIALLRLVADVIAGNITRMQYEEKLAEEKELLDVTLQSISEGIIVVDPEQRVINLNDRAEELTGWNRQDAIDRQLAEIFHLLQAGQVKPAEDPVSFIIKGIADGGYSKETLLLVNRSGIKFNVYAGAATINDKKGSERGTVLAFQDITDKVRAEAEMALAEKLKSIGQLAAGIAHEINTPMQYIGDNLVFLKDSYINSTIFIKKMKKLFADPELHCSENAIFELAELYDQLNINYHLEELPLAIEQTLQGVERVAALIQAMRGFSRSGEAVKSKADLNKAIEDTLTVSRNEWKYIAEVKLDLAPDLPRVYCAVDAINQVLLNIVINAVQAVEEAVNRGYFASGEICIATRFEGENAVIEIADNGIGIARAKMDRIFDPFFTTKEVGAGTGQGLMIAHDIIYNRHGGSIEVDSEEGKGTVFLIKLPLEVNEQ